MTIKLIVACDHANGIARDGEMPWDLPSDLKRFKRLTKGSCVVMGRKTFESIGKPLPGRLNVVVTHDSKPSKPGVIYLKSLEEALQFCNNDCFVIGGAEIYKQTIGIADMIFMTDVWDDFHCDQHFPKLVDKEWFAYIDDDCETTVENGTEFRYMIYVRKK